MKKNRKNAGKALRRVLSVLLCLAVISGLFSSFYLTVKAQTVFTVSVTADNADKNGVIIPQDERATLTAETDVSDDSMTYQWQVLADISSDEWVNILDGVGKTIGVSRATFAQILDESGSAYVRCIAKRNGVESVSDPFCVSIAKSVNSAVSSAAGYSVSGVEKQDVSVYSSEEDMVNIQIKYLDAISGMEIYTGFSAQIEKGTSYENTVISPTYLGYKPYYNPDNLAVKIPSDGSDVDAPEEALQIHISIDESYDKDTFIINVYYKAIDVPYAVKYFFQNINDDFYSEDSSLYRLGYAKTGTIISDTELELPDAERQNGFTKLYHYPQSVAADGSTAFECYYDRNYSMLKFDMDGGYGTDPVYARYQTPFIVNSPTKHGYSFVGWDLLVDGEGDGVADELPTTVPATSRSYKALWERVQTTYTVAYWLQNADDDDYSYIGSMSRSAKSGETITPSAEITDNPYICGQTHTHSSDCLPEHFKHFIYDEEKTLQANSSVEVKGDGSTVLNIYYTRRYYTLRFVYAKEYNGAKDNSSGRDWVNNDFVGTRYCIIGGSTYHFGNAQASKKWPNAEKGGSAQYEYTFEELIYNIDKRESGQWGTLYSTANSAAAIPDTSYLPQPNEKSKKIYSFGAYPTTASYTEKGDRFYYFDLTARYGADLTDLWPDDVFEPIKIKNPFHNNGGDQNSGEGEWGNYAYLAGWNGEFKVDYSLKNANSTVKGLYQKLDDELLFGSKTVGSQTIDFEYTDDRLITAEPSGKSGETVSSYVNYYLAFFNNGANIGWNVPREWNYELYVPVFQNELSDDQISQIKAVSANRQTLELDGNTYYYYATNDKVYRLYNKIVTSDDGQTVKNQTQTQLAGFTFDSSVGLSRGEWEKTARSEQINNGTLTDKRLSYTARFFYERDNFTLTMHNYNDIYRKETLEFNSELDPYVLTSDGSLVVPEYPSTLEPNAYIFGGWYSSPECLDGSEYKPGERVPASDVVLYAKWVPVQHTVRFFRTYDDMLNYEATGDESGLIETRTVDHGNVLSKVDTPEDKSGYNYSFGGWFYIDRGDKTAYNPLDIPVRKDLNVFADWGSLEAQPYKIRYVLYNKETDSERLALIAEKTGPNPIENNAYKITVDGKDYSYVYLEKDGGFHLEIASPSSGFAYQGSTRTFLPKAGDPYNQLYDGYNSGYFPTLSSHSISIEYEEDKDNPAVNLFTFTYVYATDIEYTVEYRYLDGSALIEDAPTEGVGGTVVKTTSKAVITERFAVVKDCIPDAFYKRLILAVDVDDDGNVTSSASNKLTFWYTKNETNAFYAVHYMLQNADDDTDGTPIETEDGKYQNYTESSSVTEGIGVVDSVIKVPPQNFVGFTLREDAVSVIKTGDTETKENVSLVSPEDENPYFGLTVSRDGSELYIFYTRNIQDYRVFYLKYGTDVSDLDSLVYDESDPEHKNGVLFEIETGTQKYGTTLSATAKTIPGMNCVSPLSQSIILRQNNAQNHIIFYYSPLQYVVEYRVWSYGGGYLDETIEVRNGIGSFDGSSPTAHAGYVFAGWYLDEACTVPAVTPSDTDKATVSDDGKITPVQTNLSPMPEKNIFYAKFLPSFGDLTITRKNSSDESNGDGVFVYKITAKDNPDLINYVTIKGNGSVTIKNLACREYIIEQQNDWSWRYDDGSQDVVLTESGAEVIFEDGAKKNMWLNGNSSPVKNQRYVK